MNRGDKRHGTADGAYGSSLTRGRTNTRNDDASSAEARRKLEALFGGSQGSSNPAPARAAPFRESEPAFARPRKTLGRSPSDYRMRLERLRAARDVEEIRTTADVFLAAHHQLPDDPDILYKLLQHPSEKVLKEVMAQISSLLMQRRLSKLMILDARLSEVSARIEDDVTKQFVTFLRAQMQRLQAPTLTPAILPSLTLPAATPGTPNGVGPGPTAG